MKSLIENNVSAKNCLTVMRVVIAVALVAGVAVPLLLMNWEKAGFLEIGIGGLGVFAAFFALGILFGPRWFHQLIMDLPSIWSFFKHQRKPPKDRN